MGEDNKYYTPTIDEFHIGFEYEILDKHEWIKPHNGLVILDPVITIKEQLQNGILRVKYLDKEDIEELGFMCTKSHPSELIFEKEDINDSKLIIEYLSWYVGSVDSDPEEHKLVKIYRTEGIPFKGPDGRYEGLAQNYFSGYIKNKSELKILLKQLGIC